MNHDRFTRPESPITPHTYLLRAIRLHSVTDYVANPSSVEDLHSTASAMLELLDILMLEEADLKTTIHVQQLEIADHVRLYEVLNTRHGEMLTTISRIENEKGRLESDIHTLGIQSRKHEQNLAQCNTELTVQKDRADRSIIIKIGSAIAIVAMGIGVNLSTQDPPNDAGPWLVWVSLMIEFGVWWVGVKFSR